MLTTRAFIGVVSLFSILGLAGCSCGGDDGPRDRADTGPSDEDAGGGTDDAGPREDTGVSPTCGNGTVEMMRGEVCDDGNMSDDDECLSTCQLACGDGVVNMVERCDTGIGAGMPGACPMSDADCDDMDACTTDSVASGGGCTAECVYGTISMPADGDGCCPTGADSTTDMDCPVVCGNGILETGETCDTMIAAGMPGECPTSCDDGAVCTTDVLADGGTCTAACTNTDITMPMAGDGCCPPGATPMTDGDCMGCGDGVVGMGETCDTAIAAGMPGACPTACNDMMACTRDALTGAGTCSAACTFTPITMPMAGDMCCPPGATIATDTDCMARCGDGVMTAPEECDDGNTTPGDGCSATCRREMMMTMPTAFRMTDLDIRDPHIYASVPILGCQDLTDSAPLGMAGINARIQTAMTTDGTDMDLNLDLSLVEVFRPLEQRAGMTTMSDVVRPDCTSPEATTMCTLPAGAMRVPASPVNNLGMGMVCLPTLPMTLYGPYSPEVVVPTAPAGGTCYSANIGDFTFSLSGIPITLRETVVAGEWSGSPATQIVDGLIRGFITERDANFTYIPDGTTGIGSIDCQPLSRLLPGGDPPPFAAGDPQPPPPCPMRAVGSNLAPNCAGHSDVDTSATSGRGWYMYLNFRARSVPYTEM